MPQPNIVYIHSHDTGRYIQPYGHAIPTPNIQKFAEQGVLFRQAFCAAPTCSPSRAALVTGQSPHSAGMTGLAHRGFSTMDFSQHIVATVKQAGYHTVLAGVQHVSKDASAIGYDDTCGQTSPAGRKRRPEENACEFLDNSPAQPFFLSVGFGATHRAYPEAGPDEDERYCLPPAPLPDTPETRRDMAEYKASARMLDQQMGAVFDALSRNGLDESTLVICTTDHGIAFPRMKCNLHDSGIGIMLIARGPGGFSGGKVVDAMVSHVDVFPTICDAIGVEKPEWVQGVSFAPLVRGEKEEVRDEIFAEVTYHASYEPQRCVRTKRWKYIRRFGDRARSVLPNCDDGLSKNVWLEHGWATREEPREALFDLIFDPHETNNLAGDAGHAEALIEMRDRLERWMRRTDDPLLQGHVLAPEGAAVNDPDGFSPSSGVKIPATAMDVPLNAIGMEDLPGISDRTLRAALSDVPTDTLLKALRFASPPLLAKVSRCVREEARQALASRPDESDKRYLNDLDGASAEVLAAVRAATD